MRAVTVPVSYGDAADKITILTIKTEWLRDPAQRVNVGKELALLSQAFFAAVSRTPEFDALFAQLTDVNRKLWTIEDAIRLCEKHGDFGKEFVHARALRLSAERRARAAEARDQHASRLRADRGEILRWLRRSTG